MTDAMLEVQTAVHHTPDAVVVESVVDAARMTHGTTSITVRVAFVVRAAVVTITCVRGPLAAPGLSEQGIFVVTPGDLDSLATAVRAAVDTARQQGIL